ncbi:MAG: hypothetical protein H7125_15385, partial [Proteobacteria bacterium]|nr:hypothetical protein [Burkholderiales bacterium]
VRVTGSADGASGDSAALLARFSGREDRTVVFTGYLPLDSPARTLTAQGRAHFLRWNVHPRCRDNVALARRIGAQQLLPAFGAHAQMHRLEAELAPQRLVFEADVRWSDGA